MGEPVRVLFIGGYGRSGSTLLDRLLGQIEGVTSLGELRHVWLRSFGEDQLCGCGAPFSECHFWSEVLQEAFGGFNRVDARAIERLKSRVDRVRYVPALATGLQGSNEFREALFEYGVILQKLYRAIQKTSGCSVIVDSSKDPSHGFVLSRVPDIDLSVVHLVRDSRAVAHSWGRTKLRPEIHWAKEFMPRYSILKSAMEWSFANVLMDGLKNRAKYQLVRYEDLVSDVDGTVGRILAMTNSGVRPALTWKSQNTIELGVDHTVSGNPMRFVQGPITIQPDDEWISHLGAVRRTTVTAATLPWLAMYGYLGR
ncbi:MAG: sulfotransferase [Symbiobacteriia bacterium]